MLQNTLTLPPKSLPMPIISVLVVKHACYSELWEGQGEGRHPCKLEAFLTKLYKVYLSQFMKISNQMELPGEL